MLVLADATLHSRRDFVTADVRVKLLKEGDFDENGKKLPYKAGGLVAETPELLHESGRPKRAVAGAPKSKVSKQLAINIRKTSSILEMKVEVSLIPALTAKGCLYDMQCSKRFKIATIYMRLYYRDRELDNTETIESIGAYADDIFELEEIEVDGDVDISKLEDVSTSDRPSKKRKGEPREEGFGKTGLHGSVNVVCSACSS